MSAGGGGGAQGADSSCGGGGVSGDGNLGTGLWVEDIFLDVWRYNGGVRRDLLV